MEYTYDADGNRTDGNRKVEKSYEYSVENRLKAVRDAHDLLVAMAYDGDGNRIFQLNYNLHTDDDWKGNSGNGNGNNKDNTGSGNNGNGNDNKNWLQLLLRDLRWRELDWHHGVRDFSPKYRMSYCKKLYE